MNRIKQIATGYILLAVLSACVYGQGAKVLHFPADRSVGKVFVQNANIQREIKSFFYWTDDGNEWVYHCPAKGNVRIPAGKQVKFITNWNRKPDAEDLSKLGPDDLHSLAVQCGMDMRFRADNSYLKSVGRLTGLKVLDISNSNITSRGLFEIRGLEQLERLSLGERITNSGMRVVASLKSLKALYLEDTRITDIGLAKVCENLSLVELALSDKKLTNEGLAHLKKIGTLKYLMLRGDNFTDAAMVQLKDVPSLKILHAGHAPMITDVGAKNLSEHPGLERISFHWNENITNEGAKYLGRMQSLKMLDVRHSQIDDIGLGYLSKCRMLEYLSLPHKGITDVGLKSLSMLARLKRLIISTGSRAKDDCYTDKGLAYIAKLPELEELNIGGQDITDAGMEHVAKLTKLKKLLLFGCPVTDKGLEKLTAIKSLDDLYVFKSEVTISGLKHLNELPNMKKLNLYPVKQDYSVMDLSGLKNLEDLKIGTPHKSEDLLTDADLACLSGLKKLKKFGINLSATYGKIGITNEGMKHLAGLTSMENLIIGGPKLTDDGLKYLSGMKKLGSLGLIGGSLTDEGLRYLEGFSSLQILRISRENDITDEALWQLETKLPNLEMIDIRRDENKTNRIQLCPQIQSGKVRRF